MSAVTIFVAILTGLWYFIGRNDVGYTLCLVLRQPVVAALPIGLIMGDVPNAMIIGGSIELVYIGMIAVGANLPADDCLAGLIGIPIALATGMDPQAAVAFAIPFGVLGVFLSQLRKTINAAFIHRADKGALECNHRLIFLNATVYPLLISFLCYFPVPFLANLFGADLVSQYIKYVPEWFMHGMTVAGGVLPALGFALTVFVIGNKKLIPFFIIGFFAVQYLGLNTMAAAIFSIAIALLMVFFKQDEAEGEN